MMYLHRDTDHSGKQAKSPLNNNNNNNNRKGLLRVEIFAHYIPPLYLSLPTNPLYLAFHGDTEENLEFFF